MNCKGRKLCQTAHDPNPVFILEVLCVKPEFDNSVKKIKKHRHIGVFTIWIQISEYLGEVKSPLPYVCSGRSQCFQSVINAQKVDTHFQMRQDFVFRRLLFHFCQFNNLHRCFVESYQVIILERTGICPEYFTMLSWNVFWGGEIIRLFYGTPSIPKTLHEDF